MATHNSIPAWKIKRQEGWDQQATVQRMAKSWTELSNYAHSKEIKPINAKGNQPWIFTRRTGAEAEAPILWPHVKSQLTGKNSDAVKIEGKRRSGRQRMWWLDSITWSMDMNLNKIQETVKDRGAWHTAVYCVVKHWTGHSDWTTTIMSYFPPKYFFTTITNTYSENFKWLILFKYFFFIFSSFKLKYDLYMGFIGDSDNK